MSSYQYKDPHVNIRRSRNRLIFNMGMPIPGKDSLYIEKGPCCSLGRISSTCLISVLRNYRRGKHIFTFPTINSARQGVNTLPIHILCLLPLACFHNQIAAPYSGAIFPGTIRHVQAIVVSNWVMDAVACQPAKHQLSNESWLQLNCLRAMGSQSPMEAMVLPRKGHKDHSMSLK